MLPEIDYSKDPQQAEPRGYDRLGNEVYAGFGDGIALLVPGTVELPGDEAHISAGGDPAVQLAHGAADQVPGIFVFGVFAAENITNIDPVGIQERYQRELGTKTFYIDDSLDLRLRARLVRLWHWQRHLMLKSSVPTRDNYIGEWTWEQEKTSKNTAMCLTT